MKILWIQQALFAFRLHVQKLLSDFKSILIWTENIPNFYTINSMQYLPVQYQ